MESVAKCMYCDDVERAVSHTSTDSSSEMSCTIINLILPLLIKTDTVSFCKTVWCQCKIELLLTGKFIRINMCKEGQPGTKFSWCLEGRGLLWALGDAVLLFGGGCLVGWLWLGVILVYGLAHVEVVLFFLCLQELSSYQRTRCFMLQEA